MDFSPTVCSYFANPRKSRSLDRWDGLGRIERGGGIHMVIQLVLDGDRIVDSRFMTYGCVPAIAAASMTAEWACGRRLEEALELNPAVLEELLGGLPAERRHCAELAVDTLRAAVDDARRSRNEPAR